MTHIRSAHKTCQFLNRPSGFFSTTWSLGQINQRQMNSSWAPFVLQFYRDTYFLNIAKDDEDYVAWVTILGSKKAAEQRLAKIKIKTPFVVRQTLRKSN